MEYSSETQTIVLKIKTVCCSSYQKSLKRKIFRIHGVQSVSIDVKENLLSVTGTMDPRLLIKAVADSGKVAEIVMPGTNNNHHHRSYNTTGEEHRCEEYVPVPFNDRMCGDYYCKDHRLVGMFRNSAPDNEQFNQHFPPYMAANQYPLPWMMRDPAFQQRWMGPGGYGPHGYGGNCNMM